MAVPAPPENGEGRPQAPLNPDASSLSGPTMVTDVGDLLVTWVGIQMDTIDSMVADAQAKLATIPERGVLLSLLGELVIRVRAVELEIADLKGGRR